MAVYVKSDSDSSLHLRMVILGLEVGGYLSVPLLYFDGVGTEIMTFVHVGHQVPVE